jgi:hypothetical protein
MVVGIRTRHCVMSLHNKRLKGYHINGLREVPGDFLLCGESFGLQAVCNMAYADNDLDLLAGVILGFA